ncbi:hypothetical protein EIP91_004102 [Steccherinum ochraceum]|uniref:F-box domain-containing protein n=1 Tax=Steccherinum ochraceum TaxID=92696 RepID=A0A4R0R9D9_9APHY|nr:hypothetical protein EIP91_004102 [Steccherinum ochraceum]
MPGNHSTTLTRHFPVDVIADIVDHLARDQPSLKSCSLVSRAWVYSARVHLFSKVYLESDGNDDRCEQYVELLGDSPHVCAFVRQLVLATSPRRRWYASGTRITPTLLIGLLTRIPNLHAIEFCGVNFAGAQYQPPMPSAFTMDHITFTDVGFPGMDTAHDWTRILSVFSSIGHLTVHTELPHIHHLPPKITTSFIRISTLTILGVARPDIMLEFLGQIVICECLKSLDVMMLTPEHISAFGPFVSTGGIGAHIRELRLDFTRFRGRQQGHLPKLPSSYWSPLQLGSLSSLHTITLTVWLGDVASTNFAHVCNILEHAPPNTEIIRIIALGVFRCVVNSNDGSEVTLGEFLREVLIELEEVVWSRFVNVESVVVDLSQTKCSHSGADEDLRKEVKRFFAAAMPRLNKRSALQVLTPLCRSCELP